MAQGECSRCYGYRWRTGITRPPLVKRTHRLTSIDRGARTAECAVCGPVHLARTGAKVECAEGRRESKQRAKQRAQARVRAEVAAAAKRLRQPLGPPDERRGKAGGYRTHKRDVCQACGFVPVHPVQLDVHHHDGNHRNNTPTNLRTVCANCHRLLHIPLPPDGA